jgi:hypothetical protein
MRGHRCVDSLALIFILTAGLGCSSAMLSLPSIQVNPSVASLPIAQRLQLHASTGGPSTLLIDVTSQAQWEVTTPTLASVNATGEVICKAAGATQVFASLDGETASSFITCLASESLTITGPNTLELAQPYTFTATAHYADGISMNVGPTAAWSTSDANVAALTAQGVLTCNSPGTALVSVAYSGESTSSFVTCLAPALTVSGPSSLQLIQTAQLSAIETYASGAIVDVTSESLWTSSNSDVASVTPDGLTKCMSAGSAVISAVDNTIEGSVRMTCLYAITALSISPGSISSRVATSVQTVATAITSSGISIDVTDQAVWSTVSGGARVTAGGNILCVDAGTSVVIASYPPLIQSVITNCAPPSLNTPSYFLEASDDFVGPFPSWIDVKREFGAAGDGSSDDTDAIQKAVDSLQNPRAAPVLYFPAGTYLIKQPITITHTQFFSIIGEDPGTTTLKWVGSQNGTILQTDASSRFRISRLSFDGSGIADTAENITTLTNSPGGYYSTYNEISDQHIQGVNVGIRLGVDAETTVERVFFDNIQTVGIAVETFNTLNIFINDSLFLSCGTGVSNVGGAGNFMVSNSFFAHSKAADMSIQNTLYFAARHNTSVASNTFFDAIPGGANPAPITIQNNTILDPQSTPLMLGNLGALMVIDNVIRMQSASLSALGIYHDPNSPKAIFSFGNTYTNALPPAVYAGPTYPYGQLVSYDDSVANPGDIPKVTIPGNVYIPPNLHHAVFEVPPNATGADIQLAINTAVASGVPGAVIHIPFGRYAVNKTILIPAGSNLELIGDDTSKTELYWNGAVAGPVLQIPTSNVSVKYLQVTGGSDGIRLSLADQPNTQVIIDEAQLQDSNSVSVDFDGMENATFDLLSTYTMGSVTGLNVKGAAYRAAGEGTVGSTNLYSGSMQSETPSTSFNISAGGKYMVQDDWHDGGETGPRNFVLSGFGTLTEQSGAINNTSSPFEIDNFQGNVALIGLGGALGFVLHPGTSETSLLNLGLDNIGGESFLPQSIGTVLVQNILNSYYDGDGGHQIPTVDAPQAQWMRGMLAQTRTEYPVQRLPMVEGGNRIRLGRVLIASTTTALHMVPDNPLSALYYTITSNNMHLGAETADNSSCNGAAMTLTMMPTDQWGLADAGDGDYLLLPLATEEVLGVGSVNGATPQLELESLNYNYEQRWLVTKIGDGRVQFVNRATGDALSVTANGCGGLATDLSEEATKWTLTAH